MAIDLKALTVFPGGRTREVGPSDLDGAVPVAPPPTARAHNIQRLQVGLTGLVAILLLVGLASIIKERVEDTEATIVADAGDVEEGAAEAPNDALVDAGLVPDLPAEPDPDQLPDPELSDTPVQTELQLNNGTGQ